MRRNRTSKTPRRGNEPLKGPRQLCSCRHSDGAPLSSNRYLWGGDILVCADIESAGRGARVPVEVEHDPFTGEVDAFTDERRTGAGLKVAR